MNPTRMPAITTNTSRLICNFFLRSASMVPSIYHALAKRTLRDAARQFTHLTSRCTTAQSWLWRELENTSAVHLVSRHLQHRKSVHRAQAEIRLYKLLLASGRNKQILLPTYRTAY